MVNNQVISSITPIGLFFIAGMAVLALFLPKKYLLIPLLITTCYMTSEQAIVVFGYNFYILRIIIAVSWIAFFIRGYIVLPKINMIDKVFIAWVISSVLLHTLLVGTSNAFVNRLGFAYNTIGIYGLFRVSIHSYEDINHVLSTFAAILLPLAISMLIEKGTQKNVFAVLGGVPDTTWVRDGHIRCQGPFRHPILAGTFGATLVPIFVALIYAYRENKKVALVGVVSCLVITFTTGSSGPVMTLLFGVIGMMMWSFRHWMREIRWALIVLIASAHYVMKAPVWYSISRISDILGGTGWHRAYLIDQAFKNFKEWWLFGSTYTAHWMAYSLPGDPDMADITNQYILEGVNGGLLTMLLFIGIIVACFKKLGGSQQIAVDHPLGNGFSLWCFGSALFAHVVTFLSVSYFDQTIVTWFLLIAMISTISDLHNSYEKEAPFGYTIEEYSSSCY
jgi:hypothetical protein